MVSSCSRVGAWVENPMWWIRPVRRKRSAISQQPVFNVSSTQFGELRPWNDSRSMTSTPSSANDSSSWASKAARSAFGRSFVCSTKALRGWRASALPSCASLVP